MQELFCLKVFKSDQWIYNEINFNKLHRGEHLIMKVTNEMQLRGI
jgi:hypothetical protein